MFALMASVALGSEFPALKLIAPPALVLSEPFRIKLPAVLARIASKVCISPNWALPPSTCMELMRELPPMTRPVVSTVAVVLPGPELICRSVTPSVSSSSVPDRVK